MVSNGEDMKRLNPSPVYEPLLNTNGQLEALSSCWCLNEGLSHRSLFFGSVKLHNERSQIINFQLFISVVLLLTTYQMSELFKSHFTVSFFAYSLIKIPILEIEKLVNVWRDVSSPQSQANPEASVSVIVAGRVFVIKWWVSFGGVFCLIYFITILYLN